MSINCVWCGKEIEEIEGQATMDTCEECEDFFEDNILNISKTLNELLKKNESSKDKKDAEKKAWMLSSKPYLEFKDSKYKDNLPQ